MESHKNVLLLYFMYQDPHYFEPFHKKRDLLTVRYVRYPHPKEGIIDNSFVLHYWLQLCILAVFCFPYQKVISTTCKLCLSKIKYHTSVPCSSYLYKTRIIPNNLSPNHLNNYTILHTWHTHIYKTFTTIIGMGANPFHFIDYQAKQIWCGEHSDYGSLTLVFQDGSGLQVFTIILNILYIFHNNNL